MRNTVPLILVIAIVLVLSLNVIAVEAGPKATIANKQVDFGPIEAGKSKTETVKIENKGDSKLEITKLASNSPSVIPTVAEKIIEPGKTGEIQIKFDSTGIEPCILIKYVYVYTNDPELTDRSIPITCSATVVPVNSPLIKLEPYELDLGIVNPGQKITRKIQYRNVGTAELEVEPIQYIDVAGGFKLEKNISARTIPGDGMGNFEISFESTMPRKIDSYILIKSNTAGGPYSKVSITGVVADKNIGLTGIEAVKDKEGNLEKPEKYNVSFNNYFAPYKVKVTVLNGPQKGNTFDVTANNPLPSIIGLDPNEQGKKISLQLDIIIEEPKVPATEEKKPAEGEKTGEEKKPEEKTKTDAETKAGETKSGEAKPPESGEKDKSPEEKGK